jgi:hypothetical protein
VTKVARCEVRFRGKLAIKKKIKNKIQWLVAKKKGL